MALTKTQLDKQKKEAEELLFDGPEKLGFAKALFFGHFRGDILFPYPKLDPQMQAKVEQSISEVKHFVETQLDDVAIDRNAEIPQSVIDGLAKLGVLGMAAPEDIGGKGFNQQGYCKILEILGGKCSSTSVFVNAHHSIGIRSLLLFGTEEQKKRWLPDLVSGKKLAAFALTEPNAGSDAGNVQTQAVPTEDGQAYILNGEKRYITNGGIADVLTVMARTPAPTKDNPNETKVTAFLVTPDMPGFEVLEKRAEKTGIRGTATGKMRFTNMRVPKENILGQINKGLKLALTVLDFGRTTFGATCTGHAKACIKAAVEHVKSRIQFQQPLAEFELVKKKIAFMAAHAFAMEAATTVCAALIDSGADDYMLETAILKIFATEHLWTIVYDTMQVMGGKSYFCDVPYERWMRDARINTIGEGANEVLKAFVAVVGCRAPGMQLDAMRKKPVANVGKLAGYGMGYLWKKTFASGPAIPVRHPELQPFAKKVAARINRLGTSLPSVFLQCGSEERFVQAQLLHERLADIAIDLYACSCVLSRLDSMLSEGAGKSSKEAYEADIASGKYFLTLACRRMDERFAGLSDHDDKETVDTANAVLKLF
ncbi:MAG: acyl-CoA dehydrogenase family protein [Gemmataceae bacterium]|jgi:alkylation response protein AidB-like acyl-CoA dehydrogenase|nr:acyl-CoA dehydrogenase family protein [Gemmataceae bacterium]